MIFNKYISSLLLSVLFALLPGLALQAHPCDSLYAAGNACYGKGLYADAVRNYEAVVGQGQHSAALYYNLGNAYFKQNDYASAILNYERALLLAPDDEDIRFNLELARTFTVDVTEPLPQFFTTRWAMAFVGLFSTNVWAYIALCAFIAALVAAGIFWFGREAAIKRLCFGLSVALLLLFAAALWASYSGKNQLVDSQHAIVFDASVAVKSTPDSAGQDLFILHAGTKVKLIREVGAWCEVQIADGSKGWMEKTSFRKI